MDAHESLARSQAVREIAGSTSDFEDFLERVGTRVPLVEEAFVYSCYDPRRRSIDLVVSIVRLGIEESVVGRVESEVENPIRDRERRTARSTTCTTLNSLQQTTPAARRSHMGEILSLVRER